MDYIIKKQFIKDVESRITKDKIKSKGCVCHETANPGASAKSHYDWISTDVTAKYFAHFYVDWQEIIQFSELNQELWHVKGGNSEYIGVELCHVKDHDYKKFQEVWNRGVWLFAKLFIQNSQWGEVNSYSLPAHKDITERKNIKGGHVDPISYFEEYGKTIDDFRNDVKKKIEEIKILKKEVICVFKDCEKCNNEEKEAINFLAENKITVGDGEGNFNPDEPITRKQMALFLRRTIKKFLNK